MQLGSERAVESKQGSEGKSEEANPLDLAQDVLQLDGRKSRDGGEGVLDVVVGNMEVGGLIKSRVGGRGR